MAMSVAANVAVAVAVLLTGLALLLATVAALSWRRIGHARLGWIALAFAAFAGKGAWLAADAWQRRGELAQGWDVVPWLAVVDLGIVLALYFAVLKD